MHNKTPTSRARCAAIKTLFTIAASTVILSAGITASSAKTRHHHHHVRHQHHARADWRNSFASVQSSGRSFSGIASHYGYEGGSRTASGARFNPGAMTAAHRSLPFGTKLRVSHGGRSVVVTINDRGPFVRGRVLDLSNGAARAIGLNGLGRVTAEVVS